MHAAAQGHAQLKAPSMAHPSIAKYMDADGSPLPAGQIAAPPPPILVPRLGMPSTTPPSACVPLAEQFRMASTFERMHIDYTRSSRSGSFSARAGLGDVSSRGSARPASTRAHTARSAGSAGSAAGAGCGSARLGAAGTSPHNSARRGGVAGATPIKGAPTPPKSVSPQPTLFGAVTSNPPRGLGVTAAPPAARSPFSQKQAVASSAPGQQGHAETAAGPTRRPPTVPAVTPRRGKKSPR